MSVVDRCGYPVPPISLVSQEKKDEIVVDLDEFRREGVYGISLSQVGVEWPLDKSDIIDMERLLDNELSRAELRPDFYLELLEENPALIKESLLKGFRLQITFETAFKFIVRLINERVKYSCLRWYNAEDRIVSLKSYSPFFSAITNIECKRPTRQSCETDEFKDISVPPPPECKMGREPALRGGKYFWIGAILAKLYEEGYINEYGYRDGYWVELPK
jgi:hypothetical protein